MSPGLVYGIAFVLLSAALWWSARLGGSRRAGVIAGLLLVLLLAGVSLVAGLLREGLMMLPPVTDPLWGWISPLWEHAELVLTSLAGAVLPDFGLVPALQLLALAAFALLRGVPRVLAHVPGALVALWRRARGRLLGDTPRRRVEQPGLDPLVQGARAALVVFGLVLACLPLWSDAHDTLWRWSESVVWVGVWAALVEIGASLELRLGRPDETAIEVSGAAATEVDGLPGLYAASLREIGEEAVFVCLDQPGAAPVGGAMALAGGGGAARLLRARLTGLLAPELLERMLAPAAHYDSGGDLLLAESLCPHHFLLLAELIQDTNTRGRTVLVLCPQAATDEVWRSLCLHAHATLRRMTHRWALVGRDPLPTSGDEDLLLCPDTEVDGLLLRPASPMESRLSRVGLVVCLDAQAVDPAPARYAFARLREGGGSVPPRLVVQAANAAQVEPLVRSLTGSDLPQMRVQAHLQSRRLVIVWDRDAPLEAARRRLLGGLQEPVGLDCLLLLPAWGWGLPVARLDPGHRHDEDAYERFKAGLPALGHADKTGAAVAHRPVGHGFVTEGAAVTLLDDPGNLLTALDHDGGSTGLRSSLLHVLCGNYLLRNYLLAAVSAAPPSELPEGLRPLAPQPRGSLDTLAYALYHGASGTAGLSAAEIRGQFLELSAPALIDSLGIRASRPGLKRLFTLAFGASPRIETWWPPDGEPRYRVEATHGPEHRAYLDVVNRHGERLGRYLAADHGVTFAAGQTLLIRHKRHRIEQVGSDRVFVRHVDGGADGPLPHRVFQRRYRLLPGPVCVESPATPRELPGGVTLACAHLHAPVERHTLGFSELDAARRPLRAQPPSVSFTPCLPEITRSRPMQSLVEIRIGLGDLAPTQAEGLGALAFTLCALLQDATESLFPEQHRHLAVVSPEARMPAVDDTIGRMLARLYPGLDAEPALGSEAASGASGADAEITGVRTDRAAPFAGEVSEADLRLYVIEDAVGDLGVARALADPSGLDHVLRMLRHYLAWALEQPPESLYHAYGGEALHGAFDYPATLALLERLAPGGQPPRTADLGGACADLGEAHGQGPDDGRCDFCARPLGATYHLLDDGRARCAGCGRDAIDASAEFRALYREVLDHMESDYGVRLPRGVDVQSVSAKTLAAAIGSGFTATPEPDPRAVGLAILGRNGAHSLLLENGAPRITTVATLVHELTHLWQFSEGITPDDDNRELLEGQARLVEIDYLRRRGAPELAADLEAEARRGDSIYARGYRRVEGCARAAPADLFHCLAGQLRG